MIGVAADSGPYAFSSEYSALHDTLNCPSLPTATAELFAATSYNHRSRLINIATVSCGGNNAKTQKMGRTAIRQHSHNNKHCLTCVLERIHVHPPK